MSHQEGDEVHFSETEASGGSKEGVVRWVLLVGTLLAIIFLSLIWMTGALTQDEDESEVTVSSKIQATEDDGTGTDSIVSDEMDAIDTPAADPGRIANNPEPTPSPAATPEVAE